jgi:hypothetical protein
LARATISQSAIGICGSGINSTSRTRSCFQKSAKEGCVQCGQFYWRWLEPVEKAGVTGSPGRTPKDRGGDHRSAAGRPTGKLAQADPVNGLSRRPCRDRPATRFDLHLDPQCRARNRVLLPASPHKDPCRRATYSLPAGAKRARSQRLISWPVAWRWRASAAAMRSPNAGAPRDIVPGVAVASSRP